MSLINDVINKAKEYIGVTEEPPESNNVVFNTDYYGQEVYDGSVAMLIKYKKVRQFVAGPF